MLASREGRLHAVEFLLNHNEATARAMVNCYNTQRQTALHHSVQHGHTEVIISN